MNRMITEPAKAVPLAGECDVLVAGGGIAGVAAALAAARQGKKVILLEKECALGGLATLGLVVIYLPLCDGRGTQVIGGIGEELLRISAKYGPGTVPEPWQASKADLAARSKHRFELTFGAAPMLLVLEEILLEAGVELWYDTRLCGASVQAGKLEHVFVENKSGRLAIACKAAVDCTGDGDLSALAGEETVSCDTNRRSGWYFGYDGQQNRLHAISDNLYQPHPADSRFYRGDDGKEVSQYVLDMHKFILKHNAQYNEKAPQKQYPFLVPTIPLFRMTRRIAGKRTMVPTDVGLWAEDTVGLTGDWRRPGGVYSVPFSSLHGTRVGNLLSAGRCMAAEGDTWDVMRVIPPCAVTGEAAGMAAAMMAGQNTTTETLHIPTLQGKLAEAGVLLDKKLLWAPEK